MAAINENWDTIRKVEAEMQKRTGDSEARINADLLVLSDENISRYIEVKYRKKIGANFSTKYKTIPIKINYCPFTGKPLYDDLPS